MQADSILEKHRKERHYSNWCEQGSSMDKVASLPSQDGEDFCKWKERANVTDRKEAKKSKVV